MAEVRSWISDSIGGAPDRAFDTLADWSRKAGLPGLDALGVSAEHREAAALAAASSSSMKANPVPLTSETLLEALERAR